jgi:single-strand DNA-binding protein
MASLNKVTLIGRLGQDPELKTFDNGSQVCNVSLATDETWKDKDTGEKKSKTDWHRIDFWGKLAEIVSKYCHKGKQIYVEGSIHTRKYTQDGVEKYATSIKAYKMLMLGSKSDDGGGQTAAPSGGDSGQVTGGPGGDSWRDEEDDLPF